MPRPLLVWLGSLGAGGLIAAGIWIWVYGPVTLAAPPAGDPAAVEAQLLSQGRVDPGPSGNVLSWVLSLPPAPDRRGSLLVGGDALARVPETERIGQAADSLNAPGFYVGVTDRDGRFTYLARISDPHRVRHETERGDSLDVGVGSRRGGVIAAKTPFESRGTLRVFEVDNQHVKRVLLKLPLRRRPFVESGRRYRVKYS